VHQSVEQQEVLKTSMARRDFAHDIFEAVFGALREQFNAGTVIEQIPFDDTSQRILYRCHFEDLSWVVDCSFEFSWPEGSEDSGVQPDILAGARLARSQSQAVHSADRLIGVASPKSGNTHATVEIFVGQTTKFLAQALAILEVGEPNSEPQILE
jgi:hypothetical protein